VSDGVALTRFVQNHDSEAFALLVQRFGPTVLSVCRRVIGNASDAEDAYQATFLVLMRKARTIRPPEAVGSWLFAVAHRTALYARTTMNRLAARSRPLSSEPAAAAPPDTAELMAALDAELANLPALFRDAVVLCELHGRSLKDAAGALGVPVGTLASRLARGRQMLADRLRAKGFAITAATVSSLVASAGSYAAVVLEFDPQTIAVTASSAQLADEVMKMTLLSKLKVATTATFAALMIGVFGLGMRPVPVAPVAHAAPVPKANNQLSEAKVKELDELWEGLKDWKADSSRAALGFFRQPGPTVTYLKTKLKPLKMEESEAKALITKLFSEKEDEWKDAERELLARTPLLAMSLTEVWAEAKTVEERRRLVAVLANRASGHEQNDYQLKCVNGQYFNFWTKTGLSLFVSHKVAEGVHVERWNREVRAITILEYLGTPEAMTLLEAMTDGHPEASPTVAAKEALARLKKK
jgi:RNA polymerase sigma factor (sigma-70 family)